MRHPSDFHEVAADPTLAIAEALSLLERIADALERMYWGADGRGDR
jgi:hypothetical protein